MEAYQNQSVEEPVPAISDEEKQRWVEEQSHRMQQLFEQWQKPLGIDGEKYHKQLKKELADSWEVELLKSLIESIT